MHTPRYSVVLPTLNGEQTLSVTLPEMLKIDRDDVEWLISDNHSDDHTKKLVQGLQDRRVRLVQPPRRVSAGEHLEFAYTQALGQWQGHLGDDDLLFPSRFRVLDRVLADSPALVVRSEQVHYYWPDFPDAELANTVDASQFDGALRELTGSELAKRLLNELSVHGGGSWIVHRSIINKVRARCGYFASPQHLEFFAMRAACAIAPHVATIGVPLWVGGRHAKSSGTQALSPKHLTGRRAWDWSFEDPALWNQCPFQFKCCSTLSLDAALTVRQKFDEVLGDTDVLWTAWIGRVHREMERLIRYEQLDQSARQLFVDGLAKLNYGTKARYWLKTHPWLGSALRRLRTLTQFEQKNRQSSVSDSGMAQSMGWPQAFCGATKRIHQITDVPRWVETTFQKHFSDDSGSPSAQRLRSAGARTRMHVEAASQI